MTDFPLPTAVLRPKIRIPRIRPQSIARERLFECMNDGCWRKLTLVCAQPGAGKTTLLAAWAAQMDTPVAWLTLDPYDNIPEQFLIHLAASIDAAVPGLGQNALALLSAPHPLELKALIDQLINDVDQDGQRLILVLDDYHVINQIAIHESMLHLLEHLPGNLHLVIASRSEPPLPLARLRARDQVTELRNADLCFGLSEAAEFLNQVMGLGLQPGEIGELEQQTEGWITGLQLAGLALQAQAGRQKADASRLAKNLSGSNRYVLDYLTEEVLHQQPEDVQAFLLETSILERMQAGLCQSVTGRDDSEALLRHLEQSHLFVLPLDDQDEWYRYHTLFADLLRYQLERSQPERVPELRWKAARWLEDNGFNVEAFDQYLSLKEYIQAGLLAQKEGSQLLVQGQGALFIGWFNRLPKEVFLAYPRLHLVFTFGLISIGQFEPTEIHLRALEQRIQTDPGLQDLTGEIAATRAVVASATGEYQKAIEEAHQALAYLPERHHLRCGVLVGLGNALNFAGHLDEACQALEEGAHLAMESGQASVALSALCNKGNIEHTQGRLRQAMATFQAATDLEKGLPARSPVIAMAFMGLAELHYQWNDLQKGADLSEQAIRLADQWGHIETRALSRARCAGILLALGKRQKADETMQQMEEVLQHGSLTVDPSGFLNASRLSYLMKSGQMELALHLAGNPPSEDEELVPHDTPLRMTQVKIWIQQAIVRRDANLLRHLTLLLETTIQAGFARFRQNTFVLEALIAQALVQAQLKEDQKALAAIRQALDLGAVEGFIRSFVDFGEPAETLVHQALAAAVHPAYVQRLLQAFAAESPLGQVEPPTAMREAQPGADPANAGLVEPLSERELEVLRLVVEGLSNQQIAQRLTIAPGTVKRHLHNIFGKLGVSTRPQAIVLARELKLT